MKIKGMKEKEIKKFLEKSYKIKIENIHYHPIGENGASYIIKTKNKKYFAKVFPKGPSAYKSIREIKVFIEFLYRIANEDNFNYVTLPIKNKNSNLVSRFNGFPVILENFLSGSNPKKLLKEDYKTLGKIVGRLQNINPKKFNKIKKEKFNLKYENKILQIIKKLESSKSLSSGEKELKKILVKRKEVFKKGLAFLKKNRRRIREREKDYVIIHEDIHIGNIIKNKNGLHIIDWEGLKLDLPERDLMWFRKGLGLNPDFEKEFSKHRKKKYKFEKRNIKFYLVKRLFSDINYFSIVIISRKDSAREARGYLKEIKEEAREMEQLLRND